MSSAGNTATKKWLLIDCDPGIDDCLALMMMLLQSPEIAIVGITSANGNVGLRDVTLNAVRIVKLLDMLDQVPVYQGCEEPMVVMPKVSDAAYYHGKDGLGDVPNVEPKATDKLIDHVQTEHAVNAIIRLSKEYRGRLQVVCLGGLTNLAVASKLDPDLPKRLKSLHILGGTIRGHGNMTPCSEYNFCTDPEAAYTVMRSFTSHCATQVLTYEVTTDAWIPPDWFNRIISGSDKRSTFFREVSRHTRKWEEDSVSAGYSRGYVFCDSYLAATVLDPSAVKKSKMVRMGVEISGTMSRGSLVIDHKEKGSPYLSPSPVELIEEIDVATYKNLLMHTFGQA